MITSSAAARGPSWPVALGAALLAAVPLPVRGAEPVAAAQLVVVVVPEWTATRGTLGCFARTADGWSQQGRPIPVTIGRRGCGWGLGLHAAGDAGPEKREGDGRSPAGMFAIGVAFGAEAEIDTGLEYRPLTIHDWCIDVPESPLYNRIVDDREVGSDAVRGSTEPMRRDLHLDGDSAYVVGFVIEHNAGCRSGMGSCIFAHPWKDATTPTAGCTAMAEHDLRGVLAWLRADASPRFVLLPEAEYRRVWRAWDLPAPDAAP